MTQLKKTWCRGFLKNDWVSGDVAKIWRKFPTFSEVVGPLFAPHTLKPITGAQVAIGIAKSPDNSCGLDGVRKGDLASLSPLACEWMANLFT